VGAARHQREPAAAEGNGEATKPPISTSFLKLSNRVAAAESQRKDAMQHAAAVEGMLAVATERAAAAEAQLAAIIARAAAAEALIARADAAQEQSARAECFERPKSDAPPPANDVDAVLGRCGLAAHIGLFRTEEVDDLELLAMLTRADFTRIGLSSDEAHRVMCCVGSAAPVEEPLTTFQKRNQTLEAQIPELETALAACQERSQALEIQVSELKAKLIEQEGRVCHICCGVQFGAVSSDGR
jgi:septal ring factor EnvC (AmiA/AmiB activator)